MQIVHPLGMVMVLVEVLQIHRYMDPSLLTLPKLSIKLISAPSGHMLEKNPQGDVESGLPSNVALILHIEEGATIVFVMHSINLVSLEVFSESSYLQGTLRGPKVIHWREYDISPPCKLNLEPSLCPSMKNWWPTTTFSSIESMTMKSET